MSAVVINSGLVHYEAFGRGRPVLFLHGWLGSWRYWMKTMEAVTDRHRTYALDLWGFGDSDKSKPRYTLSDHVDLVDSFVSNMGINEVPIVGHALGAAVALEYAVRYPGRAKKVMAVSVPMTSDAISSRLMELANQSVISKIMWWRQINYKEVQQEIEKTGDGAIVQSVESFAAFNVPERIANLKQTNNGTLVLAVYGEKDDIVDPTPIRNLNGDAEIIRPIGLTESKHFPMLDEAAKFNRLLKDFLEIKDDLSALELKEEWRRRTR